MQRANMKKNSINEARHLLEKFAPKGESLAFINEEESRLLKAHGGSGELTDAGIPTYFFKKIIKKASKVVKKVKERYRKIMPNEFAKLSGQLAPIVGMFNPAIGAAMSFQSTFDKTGSITDSLKSGAKTYVTTQAGRYISCGGFQGNPFSSGTWNVNAGFSKPWGTQTGLGSLFGGQSTGSPVLDLQQQAVPGIPGASAPPSILNPPAGTSPISTGGPPSVLNPPAGTSPIQSTPDPFQAANPNLRPGAGSTSIQNNPWYRDLLDKGIDWVKQDFQDDPWKYGKAAFEGWRSYVAQERQNEQLKEEMDYYKNLPATDYFGEDRGAAYEADGGRIGFANGGIGRYAGPPTGTQWDGRQGGFMSLGTAPRADDVPAMLSKDEFVMTRDAVRAAGGGSVERGAQKMYDLMNNLEARA